MIRHCSRQAHLPSIWRETEWAAFCSSTRWGKPRHWHCTGDESVFWSSHCKERAVGNIKSLNSLFNHFKSEGFLGEKVLAIAEKIPNPYSYVIHFQKHFQLDNWIKPSESSPKEQFQFLGLENLSEGHLSQGFKNTFHRALENQQRLNHLKIWILKCFKDLFLGCGGGSEEVWVPWSWCYRLLVTPPV